RPGTNGGQNTGQFERPGADGGQNSGPYVRGDVFGGPADQQGRPNPSQTGQFPAPQGYDNASTGQFPAPGQGGGAPGRHALPERQGAADPAATGQFERPQMNGTRGADFGAPRPPAPQQRPVRR
ncbi:hypothetical protein JTP67_32600, partial [Streptomyces sp. S12]|nr:hypothetical protein [Streptomyces sp. S12]